MNNSINNFGNIGDGNVINENIGAQSIHSIFDVEILAKEWCHRHQILVGTRRERIS